MFRTGISSVYRIVAGLIFMALYAFGDKHDETNVFFFTIGTLFLAFGIYGYIWGKKAAEKDLDKFATKVAEKMQQQKQADKTIKE